MTCSSSVRGGSIQEERLRPEKADPVGLQGDDGLEFVGGVEVGVEVEGFAVQGHRGQSLEMPEGLLVFDGFELHLLVFGESLGPGIDDHHPLLPVQDHHVPDLDPVAHVGEAHDRRNLQGLGEDRGVAGLAAQVGGKSQNPAFGKTEGVRGQEVARDQDAGMVDFGQGALGLLEQMLEQALADVEEIVPPLAEKLVLHLLELLVDGLQRLGQGELGVDPFLQDPLGDVVGDEGVPEDEAMGVDQAGVFFAENLEDLGFGGVQIAVGRLLGRLEALDLGLQGLGRQFDPVDHDFLVLEDIGLPDGDSRAGRDALDDDHRLARGGSSSSPNPRSKRFTIAAMASASSGPAAVTLSLTPLAASNIISPMTLLPLISNPSLETFITLLKRLAS